MAASCSKVLTLSVLASATLPQFRAVTGTGAIPAAGARCFGVTDFAAEAGERVSVGVLGTVIGEAGGAFLIDALLETDAQGRFIAGTSGTKVGRAISAASGAGAYAEILLIQAVGTGGVVITEPGAPTVGTLVAGNGKVTANWTAPASNGGSAITGYIVTPSVGSAVTVGNVLTADVPVVNGTAVTVTVKAINSAAPNGGPASAVSNSATPAAGAAAPGAPTIGTLVAGDGKVTATWAAPASDGGSAITGYIVTPSVGPAVTVGNVLTADITVANGTAVTVTVKAINAVAPAGGAASAASNSATPAASVIVAEPQLFARPAAGLFYQGMIQSVKPGTSTPITAYDAEVAYRTTIGVDNVYVDVWNGVKINGDVAEQFLSMDTRWSMTLNSTNGAGATIAFPMVKNGTTDTSLTLAGGQFSFGTFMANTPGLLGNKNFVLMIRIDSPDGVSNISVPLGNPADYGATVLGGSDGYGRGQEGSVYNSATALTSKSPGGIEWAGRVPAHMVRPLAVYTKNAPKVRSCVVLSDSIGSPLDSYVARILNAAGIANVNIGSGGESGNNYPQNTVGRSSVFPYARSAIVELGRNGFGMGLANVKAKHQAIWADLRAKGVQHVIQTEITPNTTAASTNPSPSTVEGQNPEAGGIRIQFNDWLATVVGTPGGPDEVWPVEGIVSTPDRLKFKAGMSGDYLHLLGAATTEILNVAVANNWTAKIV